uniref:Disease resistance N-terminal domain-containing protein n=1 Tax=Leersia perrieri TaxID=77586 RepID=A0A0D9V532_9ORYZ
MDTFFSAVLGDLLSRSISFIIDRHYRQHQDVEENLQRLHRLLLRIQTIIEEADSRHIKNQAMQLQLRMARDAMYRGYYFLDNFRYRVVQVQDKDEVSDPSLDLSPFSPLKRFCFSSRRRNMISQVLEKKELQKMLDRLEIIVSDMQEFVVFVSSYPRMSRQPYCSYLLLENCMFGRQAEHERIINFLLQPNHPGEKGINVLPIIGPVRVGKSTLVEYVCHDERVRKCFSTIVFYSPDSIGSGDLALLTDTGVIKHRDPTSTEQSLAIIELVDDMDDETWRKILHSLGEDHAAPVNKIILTSQSSKIGTFGTTDALQLDFLPDEAFWYFFKTIAFGSTNPKDEPKLTSICMEIATMAKGSFMSALIFGSILRSNLSAQYWSRFLECFRYYTDMHIRVLGEHPNDAYAKRTGVTYLWNPRDKRVVTATYNLHQASSAQLADLPMLVSTDILTGTVEPPEKFDVLDWRSSIPPYYKYMSHYEIPAQPPIMVHKRKRSRRRLEQLV